MTEVDYETIVYLMNRVQALEEDNKRLREEMNAHSIRLAGSIGEVSQRLRGDIDRLSSMMFSLQNQLDHQIPRINDIEDKIDWSNPGKI